MDMLLDKATSKSTTKAQSAAWAAWEQFTTETKTHPTDNANDTTVCFFVAWMFDQTNTANAPRFQHSTIKKYAGSAVRTFHEMGHDIDMSKSWAYHQLLRSIKKNRPSKTRPPLPITSVISYADTTLPTLQPRGRAYPGRS